MQAIPIYEYTGTYTSNGEVKASTLVTLVHIPGAECVEKRRLVADEGMHLVNGDAVASVVDVSIDEVSAWREEVDEEAQTDDPEVKGGD